MSEQRKPMSAVEENQAAVDLSGPWGPVRLHGVRAGLTADGCASPGRLPDHAVERQNDMTLEWHGCDCARSLDLSVHISRGPADGEMLMTGLVRNRGSEPVRLDFVEPLAVRADWGGVIVLGHGSEHVKALVMTERAGGYGTRVEDMHGDAHQVEYVASDRANSVTSHGVTAIYAPRDGVGLAAGFLDFSSQAGTLRIEHGYLPGSGPQITGLTARLEYLKPVAPGETVALASLWLAAGSDPHELLERYATRLRDAMHIRLPSSVPCGWISWYAYRVTLDERIVRETAEVQARTMRDLGGNLCHLDLGWNADNRPGDWLTTDARYPNGMQKLCRHLSDDGFEVALWCAPLIVSENSHIARKHPEWLMCDSSGRPIPYCKWYWEPVEMCYCLDPSLPAVQQHVRRVFSTLLGWGARAFKLDFSGAFRAGLGHEERPDGWRQPIPYQGASMTRIEACRKLYAVIREAIGDAHMTVCNAPWQGVIGIADSIFLANDVGNLTRHDSKDERPARAKWECFRERTRQVFARSFFNGSTWWGNPDCFVAENDGPDNHARARLQVVMLSGGQYKCSNQLPNWRPDRMAMFLKGLPWYGVAARPIDLFESEYPSVLDLPVNTAWGDWHVVGLFNWRSHTDALTVDFAKLRPRPSGEQLVWDFWEERFVGSHSDNVSVEMPAESATLLCVRPMATHPTFLASDMHFTMGGVEVAECTWDQKGSCLSGVVRRKQGMSGKLYFFLPLSYQHAQAVRRSRGSILCHRVTFRSDEERWHIQFERRRR